jgi:DNA-binding IclR family transcriptional regulator
MEDKKSSILKALAQGREMFTLEVANRAGMSSATASKYLEVLKAEGKVTSHRQTPFTYWKKAQ